MSELNQRHQLVLLFTDLTDSTRIAARLEPEHYADLLSRLRQHTNTIIVRHGGEVVRVDGDGALCIFGYPLAHEDAGRRATEAALDLHAAVAGISGDIAVTLHSGIHAGVVLLRSGDLVRGRYEMLGDATNVAARLCDAAGAGGILVSAETLGADRHFFRTGPERAIALSGHGEPLTALPVEARDDVPHRFATREIRGLSPFVGRHDERAVLLDWLGSPTQVAPVLLVHGPAGIGKSRLAKVLQKDFGERGWRVTRGWCEGYLGAPPLQPLLQIVLDLDPDFTAGDEPAERIEALIRANGSQPLLLVIDDWQWVDDAGRALIDRLARDCPASIRLLLLSREANAGLAADCEIAAVALGPLDHGAARSTIERLLAAKDPFTVAQIESATGGSPLLIEELCHTHSANGPAAGGKKLRGAWFDLSVQSRFASLATDDAGLLRLAAVVGNVVAPWLLAAVRSTAVDGAMVLRLQDADFLFPGESGDTLRFKHGLTRDAVYAAIGLSERKTLHAQVLEALERRSDQTERGSLLDALAYHACEAGNSEKGLGFAIAAGDAALATGALDRAQAHYKAAFEQIVIQGSASGNDSALRHVIKMFGRACVIDPGREHVPALERMLQCARDHADQEAIALATYWIGAHYYGLGEPRRSLAMLQRAHGLVQSSGSPSFVAQVEANLGQSSAIACRYDQALYHMGRAIERKQAARQPTQSSSSLAYCLSSRGLILADMGDFADAFKDFDRSIEAMAGAREPILASLETQRCLALIYQGRMAEAVERAALSEELAIHARARFLVYSARALGAYAQWQATGARTHFDQFAEATITLHFSDRFQRISYKYGWLAEAMTERGEAKWARLFATLALKRALSGDRLGEASAARSLSVLAARSGDRTGTDRYLKLADRAARARSSSRERALNIACQADCLHRLGEPKQAAITAKQAAAALAELGITHWHKRLNGGFNALQVKGEETRMS